jgi:hypothetical protein
MDGGPEFDPVKLEKMTATKRRPGSAPARIFRPRREAAETAVATLKKSSV